MRCIKCRQPAAVEVRRHHSAFCPEHFIEFFDNQVRRAIHDEKMFTPDDRILVAVSGGKDSLALWDVLLRFGYRATGLHINLGIPGYSDLSQEKTEAFARDRDAELIIVDLEADYGVTVEDFKRGSGRTPCSACGLSKRYIFNKVALEQGFDVVATGHNLDDEAATLLGNLIHWQEGYLARQGPVLPASYPNLVKKVKPFYRLAEREIAAYAVLRGIDYVLDECPNAVGARSLLYKEALNLIEQHSPGAKQSLYLGFLQKGRRLISATEEKPQLVECERCGMPTTSEVCSFCRLMDRVKIRLRRARPQLVAPPPAGR
jgi:uncharacterized protein (TIGR00269 family)